MCQTILSHSNSFGIEMEIDTAGYRAYHLNYYCRSVILKLIKIIQITVNCNYIKYAFSVSKELKRFFSDRPFIIEYPTSIEKVPESVLVIPFVCNVLPIIWMTDACLEIDEIDKSFYDSIAEFKKGYIQMYPDVKFKGEIKARRIINNTYKDEKKSAMFYSGGLDSASTLISHLEEKPILLSIWGSDIKYDNKDGWELVHLAIKEAADKFGLEEYVFHSSFREFDKEDILDKEFSSILGDGWWHGIKHSLALLGHVAPFAYLNHVTKMYIASTLCKEYGFATCASVPEVDNNIRFCSCAVYHDGYSFSRQQKANNLISSYKGDVFNLHVCWSQQTGNNCCNCEKCYRTMSNIWAAGAEFSRFGFKCTEDQLNKMKSCISKLNPEAKMQMYWWQDIQKQAKKNIKILRKKPSFKYFKWILITDFNKPESIRDNEYQKLHSYLSRIAIYKVLHNIKRKKAEKNEIMY